MCIVDNMYNYLIAGCYNTSTKAIVNSNKKNLLESAYGGDGGKEKGEFEREKPWDYGFPFQEAQNIPHSSRKMAPRSVTIALGITPICHISVCQLY